MKNIISEITGTGACKRKPVITEVIDVTDQCLDDQEKAKGSIIDPGILLLVTENGTSKTLNDQRLGELNESYHKMLE